MKKSLFVKMALLGIMLLKNGGVIWALSSGDTFTANITLVDTEGAEQGLPITFKVLSGATVSVGLDQNNSGPAVIDTETVGKIIIPETVTDENGDEYTVTSLGRGAFNDCSSLTGIELPSTLRSIGGASLYGVNLEQLVIPGSVNSYDYGVIDNATVGVLIFEEGVTQFSPYCHINVTEIHFPSTMTTINSSHFNMGDLSMVKTFYFAGETPPSANGITFSPDAEVIVPDEYYENYNQNDSGTWNTMTIRKVSEVTSGCKGIVADEAEIVGVYSLAGQRLGTPGTGVNIVKLSNGKTVKILR